ncbi:MAG: hypothetical protein V1708_03435 [Candidatus Micrarchaeota archaeon]
MNWKLVAGGAFAVVILYIVGVLWFRGQLYFGQDRFETGIYSGKIDAACIEDSDCELRGLTICGSCSGPGTPMNQKTYDEISNAYMQSKRARNTGCAACGVRLKKYKAVCEQGQCTAKDDGIACYGYGGVCEALKLSNLTIEQLYNPEHVDLTQCNCSLT